MHGISSQHPLCPLRNSLCVKPLYKQPKERDLTYMQHTPLLAARLDKLAKGSLPERDFPNVADRKPAAPQPRKVRAYGSARDFVSRLNLIYPPISYLSLRSSSLSWEERRILNRILLKCSTARCATALRLSWVPPPCSTLQGKRRSYELAAHRMRGVEGEMKKPAPLFPMPQLLRGGARRLAPR